MTMRVSCRTWPLPSRTVLAAITMRFAGAAVCEDTIGERAQTVRRLDRQKTILVAGTGTPGLNRHIQPTGPRGILLLPVAAKRGCGGRLASLFPKKCGSQPAEQGEGQEEKHCATSRVTTAPKR